MWIDSGSPISFFTFGELRRTIGFRDYGNNPLKMIETMAVTLESNGRKINARIKVIGGNRPSIIGRDLMPDARVKGTK